MREALEGVGDDLRFTSELLSQPGTERDHERELRALLEVVVQYKAIATYDGEGPAAVAASLRSVPAVEVGGTTIEV